MRWVFFALNYGLIIEPSQLNKLPLLALEHSSITLISFVTLSSAEIRLPFLTFFWNGSLSLLLTVPG